MSNRLFRLLPNAYPVVLDTAFALCATAVYASFAGISSLSPWFGYPLAALIGLPLAVRRRYPLPVLAVVVTALCVATVLEMPLEPHSPTAFALYAVGAWVPRRPAVTALVATVVMSGAALMVSQPTPDDIGLVAFVGLYGSAAWALGRFTRARRAFAAREEAERATRAVTEERLRIARELHDVVAHSLSLITVKAGVAAHVARTRPDEVVDALAVIEATSRDTLVEMRRLLGVLRSDDATGTAPMPGLADLAGLVERAADAGVDVTLEVTGGGLPDGVGLTVFRIVQESVTNVVKHAAPARCSVRVAVTDDEVGIEVVDDGTRAARAGGGHGLMGMRERVAMYGGDFEADRRPAGGFAVKARIPLS
ncbi:sensor histidine kinase [Saccharothrix violaceirubra]|uniref:histidine kinase n=1 Tax=Saccharothrix violaceirubra TaxID=413306 RepID=A0A7W7T1S5_9PSEU|nr:sensor histidine kinase [Saccharothrix violaceirubra]MBB4964975.1 signal transduction histidine kinase [Saccharothrix violaceirubra]